LVESDIEEVEMSDKVLTVMVPTRATPTGTTTHGKLAIPTVVLIDLIAKVSYTFF